MPPSNPFGNGADRSLSPAEAPEHATPTAPEGRSGEQILFYSTDRCGDCRRARRVFASLGVPYTYVNIEEDTVAAQCVVGLNGGMRSVPTIVFPDGTVLVEPSSAILEAKLGEYVAA